MVEVVMLTVFGTLGLLAVAAALVVVVWKWLRRRRRSNAELHAAIDKLAEAVFGLKGDGNYAEVVRKLDEEIAKGAEAIAALPKLVEGLGKVCEAMVAEVLRLREAQEKFSHQLFAGFSGDPKEAFSAPTEEDKDRAFMASAAMAQGGNESMVNQLLTELEQKKSIVESAARTLTME